jgi:hypothetical protein
MRKLLITLIVLCIFYGLLSTIIIIIYVTCNEKLITSQDDSTTLLVLNQSNSSLQIMLSFSDIIKPAYYIIVFRVNIFQFITREILPDDHRQEISVSVSYLVDPLIFEAQITRVQSNGKRLQSQIFRLNPIQTIKPIKSSHNNKIRKIENISEDKLISRRETFGFNICLTEEYILVFAEKSNDQWYMLLNQKVLCWNINNHHVIFTNSFGLVYILDLVTFQIEETVKLENIIAIFLVNTCIFTLTRTKAVVFMRNSGVWERIVEMKGHDLTDMKVHQITNNVYTITLMQSVNSTKYIFDILHKNIHLEEE